MDRLLNLQHTHPRKPVHGTKEHFSDIDIDETVLSKVSNIKEAIQSSPCFAVKAFGEDFLLVCTVCNDMVTSPGYVKKNFICPPVGSAIKYGLKISAYDMSLYEVGHGSNQKWDRFKFHLKEHITSHCHHQAIAREVTIKHVCTVKKTVIKNQLRCAWSVVQTKSAASHYETEICNLHAAGANVGDFGHSRFMFPSMLAAFSSYIVSKVQDYLRTPLASTGLPPAYYITADKSTNHRITNQATMLCFVAGNERQAVPVACREVYTNSDGTGGSLEELARTIIQDVRLFTDSLIQCMGCVTDGQYIHNSVMFSDTLRTEVLKDMAVTDDDSDEWWFTMWDPSHFLNLAFTDVGENHPLIKRFLSRTALLHQSFGYGMMHSVAKYTAAEMKLDYGVTMTFAKQRFLSSSYKQFRQVYKFLPAYVETHKDHVNQQDFLYSLCGQDFVYDMCGLIDVLWPLVLLMLRGQELACPGWNLVKWIDQSTARLSEMMEAFDQACVSADILPTLAKHEANIKAMEFKGLQLEEGWSRTGEVTSTVNDDGKSEKSFHWIQREVDDCKNDLKQFTRDLRNAIKVRANRAIPDLLKVLQKCLDFSLFFDAVCGVRSHTGKEPPVRKKLLAVGKSEFKRVCEYVSAMSDVIADDELEIDADVSEEIHRSVKTFVLESVWGPDATTILPKIFQELCEIESEDNAGQEKGRKKKKKLMIPLHLTKAGQVTSFSRVQDHKFDLLDKYSVEFTSGLKKTIVMDEKQFISNLYGDPQFYSKIGREFMVIFDKMYHKSGTEAIVESFYRAMRSQEKDGGQSHTVLSDRTKVSWCLPDLSQGDQILDGVAQLYINGDKSKGLRRHAVPVYQDASSVRRARESGVSKVVARHQNLKPRLPFL